MFRTLLRFFKKILKIWFKILKIFLITIISFVVLMILASLIIGRFKYEGWGSRESYMKKHFLENKNKFEEILKKFYKQDKITAIYFKKSSGRLIILNGFWIGKETLMGNEVIKKEETIMNEENRKKIRMLMKGELTKAEKKEFISKATKTTRLANLNELYDYYGLKKEEVEWFINSLRKLKYTGLYKNVKIWINNDMANEVTEFVRDGGWAMDGTDGIIYNPENQIPESVGLNQDWKQFERITNKWFLYES
jgi:hypothetical protein